MGNTLRYLKDLQRVYEEEECAIKTNAKSVEKSGTTTM
jgi:hypothetical protein